MFIKIKKNKERTMSIKLVILLRGEESSEKEMEVSLLVNQEIGERLGLKQRRGSNIGASKEIQLIEGKWGTAGSKILNRLVIIFRIFALIAGLFGLS